MRSRALLGLALLVAGCSLPLPRPAEDRWITRAEEMVRVGDYRGAHEAYGRALSEKSTTDRALFGLARLYVAPDNPNRDYRRAYEHVERLLREFPHSAWAPEARAWRELLAAFLGQKEAAERARQEVQRIRQDLDRLKQIDQELDRQRRR